MFSLQLKNISDFKNVNDYLPIITSALIVDMAILLQIIFGYIKIDSLNNWYKKFGFLAIIADVLSIVIGIIISYQRVCSFYKCLLFFYRVS